MPDFSFMHISRVLKSAEQEFLEPWARTGVSWSLGGKHLMHRLVAFNDEQHEFASRYNIVNA